MCRDRLRVFVIVDIYDDPGGFTPIVFIILQTGIAACPRVSSYSRADSRIRRINNSIGARVRVRVSTLRFSLQTLLNKRRTKNSNSNIDVIAIGAKIYRAKVGISTSG